MLVGKCVLKNVMYVCCNSVRNILVSIIINIYIKHNVEHYEHNEDKLQEIQNSIVQENMSILSSDLPTA